MAKAKTERVQVVISDDGERKRLEEVLRQLVLNKWLNKMSEEFKDDLIRDICSKLGLEYKTTESYGKVYEIRTNPMAELLSWSSSQPPWKDRFGLLVSRFREAIEKLESEITTRRVTTVSEILNILKVVVLDIPSKVEAELVGEKLFKPMIKFPANPEPDLGEMFELITLYKDTP